MIVELTVENLAIIERAQLTLGPGFTALTGETGAGKSLLIDAIELALGGRADTDLVRSGATRASVSLTLDLSSYPTLRERCTELGLELEDGLLYIQREVLAEGRSQARVGGRMTPINALRSLGELLVDLHGQHDHQSLLSPDRHGGYLDAWIGPAATERIEAVGQSYRQVEEARRRQAQLRASLRDRAQRLDILRFQVDEIGALQPLPGEMVELETQLSRLRHVEKLQQGVLGALDDLSEREGNARDALGVAVRSLEDLKTVDPSLSGPLEQLREALFAAEEGIRLLRANSETLEADPERLEEVASRIDGLKRLRKKYGEDEAAVLAFFEAAQAELDLLESAEESEDALNRECARLEAELSAVAAQLTALRVDKAAQFADLVQAQLRELAMDKALFTVSIRPKEIDATGGDAIEFYFSANAGEPARALARIASGGEISRVMLGIKTVLAGRAGVPTLIFDEVDTGLGGRAAAVVARKLEELAANYQVVVISHLPQIAGRALTQFHISKGEIDGRSVTRIDRLDGDDRVEEIARMLAGEHVGETALANAREMLRR